MRVPKCKTIIMRREKKAKIYIAKDWTRLITSQSTTKALAQPRIRWLALTKGSHLGSSRLKSSLLFQSPFDGQFIFCNSIDT